MGMGIEEFVVSKGGEGDGIVFMAVRREIGGTAGATGIGCGTLVSVWFGA